jgi:hypothetical protein
MKNKSEVLFTAMLIIASFVPFSNSVAAGPQDEKRQRSETKYREKLIKEVRHQLVMLPYYSVFDNLARWKATR